MTGRGYAITHGGQVATGERNLSEWVGADLRMETDAR